MSCPPPPPMPPPPPAAYGKACKNRVSMYSASKTQAGLELNFTSSVNSQPEHLELKLHFMSEYKKNVLFKA